MKKRILIFISIFFVLFACSRPEELSSEIGEEWVNSKTKVYFIDTLTVKSSTFQLFDSLSVSSSNRLLIGAYLDSVFGHIQSKTFAQLSGTAYDLEHGAVYDSVALVLKYDGYFYNDTIPDQRFRVFELQEDIKPDGDGNAYYNTTDFAVADSVLAISDFVPRTTQDSLHISIDAAFGATLFDQIKGNDINTDEEFLEEFKGLAIVPDSANTSVLGFSKDSFLRIYYSVEMDGESEEKNLDFGFNAENTFSQTLSDRTGTPFEPIIDNETILPSSETDNFSFIQAGTGLVTRLDIPYVKSLNDIQGQGTVIDAKLKFSLRQNSFSKKLYTRESVQAFIIDRKANVLGQLTYDGLNVITSTIENENPEFNIANYVMDMKPFIDVKLNETNEPFYLALYPQDFDSSVDRYIFNGDRATNDLRIKIELTYAVYDE